LVAVVAVQILVIGKNPWRLICVRQERAERSARALFRPCLVARIAAAQQEVRCAADGTNNRSSNKRGDRVKTMSARTIVLCAFLAALWLFGLVGQAYSGQAVLRYLVLSMALVAIALWRMEPRPALLRRRARDNRPPQ
jgi:hypothetical protein